MAHGKGLEGPVQFMEIYGSNNPDHTDCFGRLPDMIRAALDLNVIRYMKTNQACFSQQTYPMIITNLGRKLIKPTHDPPSALLLRPAFGVNSQITSYSKPMFDA